MVNIISGRELAKTLERFQLQTNSCSLAFKLHTIVVSAMALGCILGGGTDLIKIAVHSYSRKGLCSLSTKSACSEITIGIGLLFIEIIAISVLLQYRRYH